MDLWIRSQDKRHLVKVDSVHYDTGIIHGEYYYRLICDYFDVTSNQTDLELGSYTTEERALEVLYEIQKIITSSWIVNGLGEYKAQANTSIYEMPEE